MNCVLYRPGSDEIVHFIRDCIRNGPSFTGTNKSVSSVRGFEVLWTNDDCDAIFGPDGFQAGWSKKVSEMTPGNGGIEIAKSSHSVMMDAFVRRKQIANLTYAQVDTYIENNVTDIASAKAYLKLLSKVVLAVIKIQDKE